MTIYHVSVGKNDYTVHITGNRLLVNGEAMQADLVPINAEGLYVLRRGDEKREMHVHRQNQNTFSIMANRRHVVARIERDNGRPRRGSNGQRAGDLTAPMPGLVVQVLVKEGQKVESGQVLALLESMKMQMELRSETTGVVKRVAVTANAHVDKGSLLVSVEA